MRNFGFTLIEILITVAIVSMLVAFAIPSYELYVSKTKMSQLFMVLDGYKLKLLNMIVEGEDLSQIQVIDKPTPQIENIKLEKKNENYLILLKANLKELKLKEQGGKPLLIELKSTSENDIINWQCKIQDSYKDISPKHCVFEEL